ncbi:MAG: DUF2807 domain-containing protein [Muribaculaceae bacterium]|nr:DUF2807 domain-containing protein [Muribaculaceae bacterium]
MAKQENFRLNVGNFDKLSVYDNVHVVYHSHPDSTGYVTYKAESELADAFIFSNNNGNLKIQVATESVSLTDLPVIHVYSNHLSSVESSSDYSVKILSNAPVDKFTARVIGNGEIIVDNISTPEVVADIATGNGIIIMSGTCGKAVYKMLGAGTIQADEMKSEIVKCQIMGGGTIGCWAKNKLDIRGIGSTKIYYKGEPKIKKVGGGKVFPLTFSEKEIIDKRIALHRQ